MREVDGEVKAGRTGVAFREIHVADADAGIVVEDLDDALTVDDRRLLWVPEVDEKRLIGFDVNVAVDRDQNRLAVDALWKAQPARLALVVAARRGRPIRGDIAD